MKIYKLFVLLFCALFTSSCMEDYNERYLLKEHFVEFEEATTKSKAVGQDYVLATATINPQMEILKVQVNLVGAQFDQDQVVKYRIVADETTAVDQRDYILVTSGEIKFKANTSIAFLEISSTLLGVGETILVLELEGNEFIRASNNYKKIGIRCVY